MPPEIVVLRVKLQQCEEGQLDPSVLLASWKETGMVSAEIALRSGDEGRTDFWRQTLLAAGAVRSEPWPQAGYEMYLLP